MDYIKPYQTQTYQTHLTVAELKTVITQNAHIGNFDGLFRATKPYYGEVDGYSFELRETANHKKSSLKPLLVTHIVQKPTGTQLEISVQPHGLILTIAVLSIGIMSLFLFMNIVDFFKTYNIAPVFVFLLLLALTGAFFAISFNNAAQKALHFWVNALHLTRLL